MDAEQQCSRKKNKNKIDEKEMDRLTNLPDPIIHHILSFLDITEAVRTSILSIKWRSHWTHVHTLIFEYKTSHQMCDKSSRCKILDHVSQHRKPFKLVRVRVAVPYHSCPGLVDNIFEYAEAHNIEVFEIDWPYDVTRRVRKSRTLKTLILGPSSISSPILTFKYPLLTTLQLYGISIYGCVSSESFDLFKGCLNMENLRIEGCRVKCKVFHISAPRLVNLVVSNWNHYSPKRRRLVISAPSLEFLDFDGMYPLNLTVDKCATSLQKVNIRMFSPKIKWVYVSEMMPFVDKLSHTRKLKVLFDYSGGKLIMHRDRIDEEVRIVEMVDIHGNTPEQNLY